MSKNNELPPQIKKKNSIKVFRTVLQVIGIVLIGLYIAKLIYYPECYKVPDKQEWVQKEGFVAISYKGISEMEYLGGVSKENISDHFQALYEAGYETINTQDIVDFYYNDKPLPEKALYIMFEDGRKDSLIFGQPLLRKYNYCASMMSYASNIANNNEIFIKNSQFKKMTDNGYWDMGTNGYRFSYINVQKRDDYKDMDGDGKYNEKMLYYDNYLMDYLRDDEGLPAESYDEMAERINWDYDMMNNIYKENLGYIPKVYAIMHSDRLFYNMADSVEKVNLLNIQEMFKIMFNRKGSCYNHISSNPYNLIRMQVQEDWDADRLIKEIENYTDSKTPYSIADGDDRIDVKDGAVELKNNKITMTSNFGRKSSIIIKGTDGWGNVDMGVCIESRKKGTHRIILRKTQNSFISIDIYENRMVINQNINSKISEVYNNIMPEANIVKDSEYMSGVNKAYWDIDILLKDDKLYVSVGDEDLAEYGFDIDEEINTGSVMLESFGEVEIFRGVFSKLKISPILY